MTIPAIAREQTPFSSPGRSDTGDEPEETPIPEVAVPGESFRKAYFALQPGSVAVAPNQPETVYYVMVLERREPATFAALYAPNGDEFRYKSWPASRPTASSWRLDGLAAPTGGRPARLGARRRGQGERVAVAQTGDDYLSQ